MYQKNPPFWKKQGVIWKRTICHKGLKLSGINVLMSTLIPESFSPLWQTVPFKTAPRFFQKGVFFWYTLYLRLDLLHFRHSLFLHFLPSLLYCFWHSLLYYFRISLRRRFGCSLLYFRNLAIDIIKVFEDILEKTTKMF